MVFALAACGNDSEVIPEDTAPVTEPSTEPTVPEETKAEDEIYREGSAEEAAQKFIKSLLKADYKTARSCFDVPSETPYFTAEDVQWYLPRSVYADILDLNYTDYLVSVEKEYANNELAKCKVTISDKNSESKKEFTLNMHLSNANKWGVEDSGFYFTEYYIVAPGGKTVVKLDDNKIPDSLKYDKFGTASIKDLYKLEYVGKSEKTISVSSETYDTVTKKMFPEETTAETPYTISVYYTDSDAYTRIAKIWDGYYSAVLEDLPGSEMTHTIAPSADQKTADMLLTAMKTMINKEVCSNYQLLNVKECSGKEFKSEYLASDKVVLYLNYTLSWVDNSNAENPSNHTMNYYDAILLHLENEKFTIQETLNQNNIFSYKNSESNEKR